MLPYPWTGRLASAALCCMAPLAAWSQASPYALSVFQTVTYQPNVFQVPDGQARTRDFISSTGVNFGVTREFDGLTAFANGNAQANVYQDSKALNNPSYGINLGLTSTVERLSSTLRYAASQNIGDYGTPGVQPTTERNLQTNQEAALALRYRMTPRTNLVGGLGYQSLAFSASAFDAQENSSAVATIDVTHQLNPELTLGAGVRYSNGVTPRYAAGPTPGSFIADRFDGRYLDPRRRRPEAPQAPGRRTSASSCS